MKKKLLSLCVVLVLLSCEQQLDDPIPKRDFIKCKVVDRFSNQPITDAIFVFDVASGGGGWSGIIERAKYFAISDSSGNFVLNDLGVDMENTFYPEFGYHSSGMDTLLPEYRYFINGIHSDSLWIVDGINTILKLKPAAITYFHHPVEFNSSYSTDTIIVKTHHQTDTINYHNSVSEAFYLLPSQNHQIQILYLKNGGVTSLTIQKYISKAMEINGTGGTTRFDFNINIPE